MKQRILYITMCVLVALAQPMGVSIAQAAIVEDHVVILAVQTGQVAAAGNDFVEVYNPMATTVDVTGWKLQYRAASATGTATWTTKRAVACVVVAAGCTVVLAAHGHMVFSTYDLPGTDKQLMSSGLSDVGGQLRLVRPDGSALIVQDMVGYGTAAESEGGAAPAPAPGTTLVRKTEASGIVDTNNNANDFAVMGVGCYGVGGTADNPVRDLCAPPPPVVQPPVEPPVENDPVPSPPAQEPPADPEPDPVPTPTPTPDPEPAPVIIPPVIPDPTPVPPEPVTYPALRLSELLPNPASPATDAADEYVELYNPGDQPVVADGYTIQTGTDFSYHYTLTGVTIPAQGYVTLLSSGSHLVLSNTAGLARLLDPSGAVIDQTAEYGAATAGQTWALVDGVWQWTTVPTPAAANLPTPAPTPPADPVPDPTPTPNPEPAPTVDPPADATPVVYAQLLITELLPDPIAPQRDESDEFIELYNPGTTSVSTNGYTLEAGTDFRYKFVLNGFSVLPGQYLAITAAVSHVPLSNSGVPVRLIDPAGNTVDAVASYGVAKPGQTWAKTASGWQWTITPTPGAANTITAPVTKAAAKASKVAAKTAKKKTTTAKVAAAKITKTPPPGAGSQQIAADDAASFNYWLLAPIGLLVFGYLLYEYRQNILRLFRNRKPAATQQTD